MSAEFIEIAKTVDVRKIPIPDDSIVVSKEAIDFDEAQHAASWQNALRNNPKAFLWCCYSLFTCVMWGYDGLASGIVLAVPQFRKDFGYYYEGQYVISASWQLGFTGSSLLGILFGGVGAGIFSKSWGRQLCMFLAYGLTVCGVFMQYFATNIEIYFASKVITGIPLGVFITITPSYCAEIAPLALRGTTTSAINWSIVLGQLIGYGVLRQTKSFHGANSYRILFAVQWGFAAVALAILPFFPESPYHLLVQGRPEKARKNIARLYGPDFDINGFLASIKANLDAEDVAENLSFAHCFKAPHKKRTLLALSAVFVQNMSGNLWVIAYMAYFFVLDGMEYTKSTDLTVGMTGLMLIGTMCGWVLLEKCGRRPTFLWGAIILSVLMILIGILDGIHVKGGVWAQATFMALWGFIFQATIASAAWPLITEIPASALRGQTVALATMTTGLCAGLWSFALPYLMNPDQANLKGKIGFIYGGILALCSVGIFFLYPETKGRTFREIDTLFAMGIPTRKFSSTSMVAMGLKFFGLRIGVAILIYETAVINTRTKKL